MNTCKHFFLLSIIYGDKLRDQAIQVHSILLFSLAFFYLSMTIFRRVKICPTNKHLYPLRFFSVCLSVTFFLPAKFFLSVCNLFSMYVCNIFLSPMFSLSLTVYLRYLCLYFGHVLLLTSPHRERERWE